MDQTAALHRSTAAAMTAVLDAVPADRWDRASPCAGWTARDVVAHVVDTQRELLTTHGGDVGPRPDLEDPAVAYRAHRDVVQGLLTDELVGTAYDGFFGPTTVGATLEQFYVWDLVVHRWDVARATGGDESLTGAELDRVEAGADSFGESLHMDGICGPALPVGADADRQTALLARLGRRA
ncbi:TIGR03086 family metal-binding protein [Klenkia sp. PcliD-1-E]|uniref:TIGR03086 family metal-binding protein n=1 Tax=Klenkia sp. PcliD-1-E TaxID=2954492 RepID=UPI002096C6A1|nr:TIGR03086 family metal-binding protein [Klenkia sp. PcliD-1-E]MCO7222543.1 TIGR03086 family metal-binding protein [Klenkia sp. PcliD-1-E]